VLRRAVPVSGPTRRLPNSSHRCVWRHLTLSVPVARHQRRPAPLLRRCCLPPVARTLECIAVADRLRPSRLQPLLDRLHCLARSALRPCSLDCVIRFRWAFAVRDDAHPSRRESPGQGLFANPQGCPQNFSFIPRICAVPHRSLTASCTASRDVSSRSTPASPGTLRQGAQGRAWSRVGETPHVGWCARCRS
jgi:hypothetical protein